MNTLSSVIIKAALEFASAWLVTVETTTLTFEKIDNNIVTDLSL